MVEVKDLKHERLKRLTAFIQLFRVPLEKAICKWALAHGRNLNANTKVVFGLCKVLRKKEY